jgi:tetratricopeptide (TPR) repeat protein
MRRLRERFLVLAAPLLLTAQAHAAGQAFERLLTSNPAADYHPAVSPDGRWLVYTSDRDGAPGLYSRDLRAKGISEERRVAPHPAKADGAVFSPDGRHLAFTSYRADAFGDIFLMRFPDGEPRAVTQRGAVDSDPEFSADGKSLYFRSGAIGGEQVPTAVTISDGTIAPRGEVPALDPPVPFPALVVDGLRGAALLYSDDTNGDHDLGPGDDPTAWLRRDGAWWQASYTVPGASGIALNPATGELVVSARWFDNEDVALLAKTPLQTAQNVSELMAFGEEALNAASPGPEQAVALFRAARQRAASDGERIPAAIALLRALNHVGRSMEVSREGEALLAAELSPVESARITLQYLIARSVLEEERARDNPDDLFPPEDIEGRLKELVTVFEANDLKGEAAEVHYQLALLMTRRNMPKEALAETEKVFGYGDKSITEQVAGSTVVLRAELFGRLGLGPETERTLLGVYTLGVTDRAILDGAADRLLALTYERATKQDQRILELRNLAARAEKLPYLLARVKLAEGKLLEELDSYTEAEAAYRVAANQVNEAVAPALQAALQLAAMHARRGRYQDAVVICADIERSLAKTPVPGAEESYREIRRELIRYYMEKGRTELRLGDPMLAHSTFEELLKFDPTLPQAWRGKLGAIGSDKVLIAKATREFEQETKANPDDGLAWYKLGLALSYIDPASERARRAVTKAITADSAVPYYHLTLGFILEQIYKKGSDRKELLEQAALSYEQAVMLADLEQDPEFFSDALLNSANVALTLGQFYKAHGLYQRRAGTGFAFIDPRTELLFHWNAGIAAFRSSNPKDAAREFASAIEAIKPVDDGKLVPAERLASIVQELKGRRALALMDAGVDADSARLFGELADESPALSMDRVRALRNRALVLERLSGQQSGAEREATLEEARSVAEQGLVEVKDPGLQDSPDRSTSKAFIDFTYAYSASTTGGAQLDFNRRDEERLLRATLGRVLQLLGEGGQAIVELQGQLDLDPKITDGNRAYYFSARSVTLSRIAAESLAGGDTTGAVSAALQGLTISHYQVAGQWFVNPNSATLFLGKLVEIVGATDAEPSLRDPKAFWMLGADEVKTAASNWELLDRAAEALLVYPDPALPGTGSVAVIEPLQQARLDLVRAISQERLYEEAIRGGGDAAGVDALRRNMEAASHAGRANAAADELLALCRAASNTEDIYLLGTLASAVKIRLAFSAGLDAEGEKQAAGAQDFARQTGQPALSWWLMAQAATTARTEEARLRWTKSALDQLLSQAVYTEESDPRPPEAMLAALEAMQLDKALRDNDAAALWTVTENWRIVRLRWLATGASAPTRTADEGRWLQEYVDLCARYTEKNRQLRRTPFASAVQRAKLLAECDVLAGRLSRWPRPGWIRGAAPLPIAGASR